MVWGNQSGKTVSNMSFLTNKPHKAAWGGRDVFARERVNTPGSEELTQK
jgi:hypothetical protein